MTKRFLAAAGVLAMIGATAVQAQQQKGTVRTAAPINQSDLPAKMRPDAKIIKGYVPPKTAWGDPQLAGAYTNSDESGIPFERPAEFDGKKVADVTPEQLAEIVKQRQEQTVERTPGLSEFPGATSPLHWFENYRAANSRAWLVTDETDGKVPPTTDEATARNAARARARGVRGPADSAEDRSMYDRCITRGIPGSMMPAIYGNSYQILQGPGYVAIKYEMVNETRIIPLGPAPHLDGRIRRYLGDARGHFDGNTLVVETTNFTDVTSFLLSFGSHAARNDSPARENQRARFVRHARDQRGRRLASRRQGRGPHPVADRPSHGAQAVCARSTSSSRVQRPDTARPPCPRYLGDRQEPNLDRSVAVAGDASSPTRSDPARSRTSRRLSPEGGAAQPAGL